VKGDYFGNPDETISSAIGRAKLSNKLTFVGKALDFFLNLIDKNHSIKSIEDGTR
jgi:8-oxo-dGTP diphosphatase